jgi:hypothetical protein
LLQTASVGVTGLYLQGVTDVLACSGKLVLRAIEPGEREPRCGAGMEFQGGLRFGTGLCIVTIAAADFR